MNQSQQMGCLQGINTTLTLSFLCVSKSEMHQKFASSISLGKIVSLFSCQKTMVRSIKMLIKSVKLCLSVIWSIFKKILGGLVRISC